MLVWTRVGLVAVLLLPCFVNAEHVIGVVVSPMHAQVIGAAVEAGIRAALDEVVGAGRGEEDELVSVSVTYPEPDEPLAVAAQLCIQAENNAVLVVAGGDDSGAGAELAAAAAARAGLPLALLDQTPANASWEALALYPHYDVFSRACVELCAAKGWRQAVLLHSGSPHAAALLAPDDARLTLLARQLPASDDELRNLLLVLKKAGAKNFIIWSSASRATEVLDAAQRVGLLAARHSYIVLTLDLHTLPLADFSHGGANITALRLYEPESEMVMNATRAWRSIYMRRMEESVEASSESERAALVAGAARQAAALHAEPTLALLLAHDAAYFLAHALLQLGGLSAATEEPSCQVGKGGLHASTLLNYLRSKEWLGTCGATSWEADGRRHDVALQVAELVRGGELVGAGRWSPHAGLQWTREPEPAPPQPQDSMTNRTFTVLIAMNNPYVMRRESADRLSGNDRYEGFCIELIDRLSKLLDFNYTFVVQADGSYGVRNNVTGQWNGMMRRLMDEKDIDFAITDLTITAEREQAVDFTTPFMNLGISILFRTPVEPEPAFFAFLLPFSSGVWLCLGFAYLFSSLLLYVIGRLCPEEWQNPYPCIDEPPALENQFTLANAFWFNLGSVLLQGSEIAPVAYGTRAAASAWWFFALVITSSYTANLATLLAKKTSTELIHNVDELADSLDITYGAKANGATYTFFEHSPNKLYQKMYEHMKNQKMPESNEEGILKVMREKYAFLMESTTIDYTVSRNCEVTKVGGLLDSKGYGIAMKKSSPYRQAMNLALLNLQEAGVLREMQNKWWNELHGGGACAGEEERESEKLSMKNFLGLFLVLVVGCGVGVVISFVELAWHAARHPRDVSAPFARRLWSELRFVFRFQQVVKPLQGALTPPASEPSRRESSHEQEMVEAEEEEAAAAGAGGERLRSGSPVSGARVPRRRSSMHTASVRLARHARASGHQDS